ncbi:hypothetical protein SDC9_117325 [bioreactor metagenome]|uniref:Uncharacterized protein n=1 Tax=bioreactor metagenome TaxID=1076179 RepID=A0A645BXZ9_9ZZZZ
MNATRTTAFRSLFVDLVQRQFRDWLAKDGDVHKLANGLAFVDVQKLEGVIDHFDEDLSLVTCIDDP